MRDHDDDDFRPADLGQRQQHSPAVAVGSRVRQRFDQARHGSPAQGDNRLTRAVKLLLIDARKCLNELQMGSHNLPNHSIWRLGARIVCVREATMISVLSHRSPEPG